MAFASLDDIAIASIGRIRQPINKASLATQIAGSEASLWRATSIPAQGAIPTTWANCTHLTAGAIPLAPRSGGQERILSAADIGLSVAAATLFVEDRLGHMGGLSGIVVSPTAQTVNADVSVTTDNMAERIGAADFSEVEWYLEWYTATGATVSTPTINCTFGDNTTGTAGIWVAGATALPASVAASRRYKIVPSNGKPIKSIQSVTLSASTGTAGNFGVTAVKRKFPFTAIVANRQDTLDWAAVRACKVPDSACLTFSMMCATTSTGTVIGGIEQAVR